MIAFDDFKKIELKIARITEAEEVVGAEKLLKLQIDMGGEKRQVNTIFPHHAAIKGGNIPALPKASDMAITA